MATSTLTLTVITARSTRSPGHVVATATITAAVTVRLAQS
jgi:hypothetical protein